jgi:hypothetical protein
VPIITGFLPVSAAYQCRFRGFLSLCLVAELTPAKGAIRHETARQPGTGVPGEGNHAARVILRAAAFTRQIKAGELG